MMNDEFRSVWKPTIHVPFLSSVISISQSGLFDSTSKSPAIQVRRNFMAKRSIALSKSFLS